MTHQDNKDLQETWEALSRAIDDLNTSGHLTPPEIQAKYELVKRLNRRYDTLTNRVMHNVFRVQQETNKKENFKLAKEILVILSLGVLFLMALYLAFGA